MPEAPIAISHTLGDGTNLRSAIESGKHKVVSEAEWKKHPKRHQKDDCRHRLGEGLGCCKANGG